MNRSTLTPRRLAESAGRLASVLGLAAGLALTPDARAQVQGAQVVSGSATINSSGGHTVITAGHNAIINYQAFNIQAGQSVQFIQPGASARVLNRITGPDPTTIAGSLTANGIVYIANPAGVYFAHGALVDVGGIYAAAGSITNADFIGNINRFTQMSGVVENRGTIQGGTVALIGARAANFGTIATPANGMVTLAAGSEVYLADGDKRIMAKVAPANIGEGAGVTNAGTISAPKGRVSLGAGDMYALAIDQRGTISARDVSIRGGQGGVVSVSGTVSVAGTQPGEKGGRIEVLGDKVGLFGGTLDASGPAGGGEILVGGNYQGKGAEPNASATYISHDARIRADATGKGNGGRIIVWSDFSTRVYGQLSARGGALAGNGGFIETSGANLDVRGTPDLTAARGLGGTWLIDPRNVTIDQVANSSGFPVIPPTSPFVPDADGAILDIDDLLAALSGGANVIVQTGAGGAELGNITLATTLDFNGLGSNSLSLIAHNDIIINAQILDSVAGGGDLLNLTLTANSDAAGGGMVRVNQSISLGGGSFTASGDGVELSAGLDAGALTFNAPVILKADTILAGTSIAFNDTLDTDGTAWDLTLNTSGAGATTFAGRVGDTDALGVLTTNADGSTVVDTDVVNADTIALNDAVLIGVDSVFTTTSGTTFGGMLNSETDEANDLTLNGPVAFNGAVGADTGGATTQGALGTLTASDAASISGASMRAAVLDFADAVTVKANTTLTGTTSITFQSTLDCEQNLGRTLALNSPLTTFGNQVGFLDTNSGFVSLTTDAAGTTNINTDRVKAGVLTLNDAAVIGVDTILIGTTSVSLAQVDSAAALARSLTINSPTTLFSGQVGNAAGGTLGTLSTNSAGTTTINTGVIKAATLDFQDAVVIAADTTLTGAAAFASTVNSEASEANDLILVGATTFNGVVGGAANGALGELNVSGGTASINAADISAATMQFGATVLRTSTTLTGTGVTFSSTVDSEAAEANSLTVSATTLSFQGVVGGAVSGELGTLTTTGTTTTINAPTIEAATMFFGATQLDTSVTLTGTAVTFGSTLNSQASEANSLTVTASTLALNGAVGAAANGALGTLTATAATTTINTASVNAATMLFGVTVLEASTTLAGTSVSFSSTLNSAASEANSLTVNAGTLLLNGVVGRAPNGALGTLTATAATTTINTATINGATLQFGAAVLNTSTTLTGTSAGFSSTLNSEASEANSLTVNAALALGGVVGGALNGELGTLTASGTTAINTTAVTAAILDFAGAVTVNANATLTGATSVTFQSTLDGESGAGRTLAINSPVTIFGDEVGFIGANTGFSSLTTDAAGTTTINGARLKATAVTFNDAVLVGADLTIAAAAGSVQFQSTVNSTGGARDLTINTTTTGFAQSIGAGGAFDVLTTDAAGTTTLSGAAVNAATVSFQDNVLLATDVTVTGASATFGGNVNSSGAARNLTVNGSTTLFGGQVGNTLALATLLTDAPGTTTLGGNISATLVDIRDAALIGNDLTITAPTALFAGTLNSENAEANDLTITGAATFNGVVGGAAGGALGALATGGATTINTSALTAATMNFGATVLNTSATLTGAATFSSTLDSEASEANSLTVNAGGSLTLSGVVGGALNGELGTLSSASATTIATSAITAGVLTFGGAVTVNADSTLNGSTSIAFQSTLDSQANQARSLTLNSPLTTFGGEVGFVGANTGFGTLATDAAGTTTINAPRLKATTFTFSDAVLVGADSELAATGGTVQFLSTLNTTGGARDLAVNATTTLFAQAVGGSGAFGVFTTDAAGTTTISGGILNAATAGLQDAVLLGADLTATGTSITFGGDVNSSGGVRNLTVNATTTAFNAQVGNTSALGTLLTDAPGSTTLGGNVVANIVTLGDNSLINGPVAVTATSVTFSGTVNSGGTPGALSITSPVTLFGSSVGNTSALASLTTDAAGTTRFNGATVAATGALNFQDHVLLGADVTMTGGSATFALTVNNATATARALTVNAATTLFGGQIGNGGALASLTTDAAGTTTLGSGSVLVTGAMSFQDNVLLTADTTLTGGSVAFGGTVNSSGGARDLTVNAPSTSFAGAVGNSSPLDVLTTNAAGTTTLGVSVAAATMQFNDAVVVNGTTLTGGSLVFAGPVSGTSLVANAAASISGGSVATTGDQTWNNAVLLGANTVASGANISFLGTLNSLGAVRALTVNTSGAGTTRFAGIVGGGLALASLTTNADGTTVLDAGLNAGTFNFQDAVLLGSSVTLAANAATFGGTLQSQAGEGNSLTLNTTTSTFNGVVGDGGAGAIGTLTTGGGTTSVINTASFAAGTLLFGGSVSLSTDSTLTGTAAVTFNADLNSLGGVGRALTVNSPATAFNGTFGSGAAQLGSLTTDAAGVTTINTASLEANAVDFQDAVILAASTTVSGASVAFRGTLDSAAGLGNSLTVNSPGTLFAGPVGVSAGGALGTLTTDGPGATAIEGAVLAATLNIQDALAFSGGTVTTTADQTYGGVMTLGSDTTLAGQNISFLSTLDSSGAARNLAVNTSGGGLTRFAGAVGASSALATLTTNADGTTAVGSSVAATTTLAFQDAVRLDGDSVMSAATITFGSTLDSGSGLNSDLAVNATNTQFAGAVGGIAGGALGQLTTDDAGTTLISGGSFQALGLTFNDALTLASSTTMAANAVTFGSTVSTLGLNRSLSVSAGSITIAGGSVTTSADQTYAGGVVLAANTTLAGQNIAFSGTLNSDGTARNLTLNPGVAATLGGTMGGSSALGALTVNGLARLGADVTTAGAMLFNGAVRVFADSVLRDGSDTGMRFAGTIDSEGSPSALTLMVTSEGSPSLANPTLPRILLGGDIGSTLALSSLTLGGPRTSVPPVATIVAGLDDAGNPIANYTLAITTTGGFTMGPNEKLTVLGSLVINAGGAAILGDINTLLDLTVNASSIGIRLRAGAPVFGAIPGGGGAVLVQDEDFGVDIVGRTVTFSVAPGVVGSGIPPTFATPSSADISGTLSGFTQRAFGDITLDLLFGSGAALDLKSAGPSNANFAEAIAGAAPRESQSGTVASDTAVGRAQFEELAKLGVYARPLDRSELVDFLIGRALYLDVPSGLSPQAEDFKVAVDRLPGDIVNMVLESYRNIFAREHVDPETGQPIHGGARLTAVLSQAWAAYAAEAGENADPARFRAQVAADGASAEAAGYLDSLQTLFTQLQYLGLTPLELRIAKTQLAAAIPVQGLTARQLETAVMATPETAGTLN